MMPPLTWRQRILRQVFPCRGVRDCCYYHRQDFQAIAATVNGASAAAPQWPGRREGG
jgi:hypothetical protein